MSKVKSSYEKVNMSLNDIAKAMIDGEVFYNETGSVSFSWARHSFCNSRCDTISIEGDFYRRVTTPVQWYEDIPEGGVMCRVWDDNPNCYGYAVISRYGENSTHPFKSDIKVNYDCTDNWESSYCWQNAEPLNKTDYNFAEDL